MELVKLFDEERYITGPEERREQTEEEGGGVVTWSNGTFKRVRLFKTEAAFKENRSASSAYQRLPLYLLIEDVVAWKGEDPRYPNTSQRKRTYVSGSDSTRVRAAVKIADDYGGKVNR